MSGRSRLIFQKSFLKSCHAAVPRNFLSCRFEAFGGATALESALVLARRCDATIRLIHVIEAHHHALHVSQPKSRQSKIEEKVTKSGADLEEIVESRTDCFRRINYEVRVGNPFFELILA